MLTYVQQPMSIGNLLVYQVLIHSIDSDKYRLYKKDIEVNWFNLYLIIIVLFHLIVKS